jgi:hypothetical protein
MDVEPEIRVAAVPLAGPGARTVAGAQSPLVVKPRLRP